MYTTLIKSSPFASIHQSNGAEFRDEDGWRLALHFGAVKDEYQAVRTGVGLLDRSNRSLLRFTGEDRVSFLQGMVSNDVTKLNPGSGMPAAFADIQGKILADAKIFCTEEAFIVELWEPLREKIHTHLQKYLIADDVEITDQTDEMTILSVQGPRSPQLVAALMGNETPPDQELGHGEFQLRGHDFRIVRATHTGEIGFDLWIAPNEISAFVESLEEKGKDLSVRWVGTEAQEILRIEAGIPRYGKDMDQENLVLETNLDSAVNFDKGCYLGQEVIERIHSRGHVNRKLTGLVLEGKSPADHRASVHADGKEAGWVTSSVYSPLLQRAIALGYVHKDQLSPGTPVSVEHDAKSIRATVSPLPFRS
ncbi:MAG: hypothetical protein GTO40_20925 [Deltaproteobacteria bacterium]|nr:hypothetical protein [Deltaproteobacteria bacterium]